MEIGPIPNIPAMPAKVPSATPADLPSTRAVEFYPQQEDSSYTPSQQGEQEAEQQETAQQNTEQQNLMQPQSFLPEPVENSASTSTTSSDDPPAESTVSFFA